MRTLRALLLLCLLALPVRAQEGVDAATSQLPKGSPVAVRINSLDRVDALVKDWVPILKAMGMANEVAPLEQMPASAFLFTLSGLSAEMVDTTKPIYLGMAPGDDEQPLLVLHPPAGAAWEGRKELREGAFAILRGGVAVAGPSGALQAEPRGTPTVFRANGDLVIHVYLGDLIAEHKAEIEQSAAEAAMMAGAMGGELPEGTRALILPVVTAMKDGVLALESFDYGVTWTGERLESEGFLAVQEGSGLRNLLKRAGAPGDSDLVSYLPKESFLTISTVMNPDWPAKEMNELFAKAGGEAVAKAIMQLMSMGSVFQESTTGRSAVAMNMGMMSASVSMLYELKPDVDPAKMVEGLDFAKANEALQQLGIPMGYIFEKNVGKHGETPLHRFGMTSEDPMLAAQFAMMQGCMAVEKGMLFMALSPTAEDDLRSTLDRVRRGEKVDHPHAQAMARLGRAHNIGFTLNLGALKPMAMMFGMFGAPPDVVQAFQNIPDVLPLSTAVTFPDGNMRWRGDFPVKEIAKIAEAIQKAMPGAGAEEPPAPEEGEGEGEGESEDFD